MIIENKGNPSVKDFVECGYSEGFAVEAIIQLSNKNVTPEKLVKTAEKFLKIIE